MSSAASTALCTTMLLLGGCPVCHAEPRAPEDAEIRLLEQTNVAVNHSIVFVPDAVNWGEQDHWTTPDELRIRGSGDCEDYAIAKFFALLSAGLPPDRLRLVYARVQMGGTGDVWVAHMVVAYLGATATASDDRILDNLLDEVRLLSRRPDLRVLISFDAEGVWRGLNRGTPERDARQIARWAGVLHRMSRTQ